MDKEARNKLIILAILIIVGSIFIVMFDTKVPLYIMAIAAVGSQVYKNSH